MLRVTAQIVSPRQPPLPEADRACLELTSDLSPSTQGMIFVLFFQDEDNGNATCTFKMYIILLNLKGLLLTYDYPNF